MRPEPHKYELPFLVAVWYLCTAFASIETRRFAVSGGNLFEFLFWSFFLAVPLWIYSEYAKQSKARTIVSVGVDDLPPQLNAARSTMQTIKSLFKKDLAVALLQACHIHFTNITIGLVDVKFAYLVQCTEPLVTLVVTHLIALTLPAATHVLALMPVPYGVYLSTATGISNGPIVEAVTNYSLAFFTAFISVATISARNVLFKGNDQSAAVMSHPTSIWTSSVAYWRIASVASVCLLPGYLYSLTYSQSFIFNASTTDFPLLAKGVLLSLTYNTLSFITLARVDPISHSILNVVKRILTVALSMFWFSTVWIPMQVFGIILANLGVVSYALINNYAPVAKADAVKPMSFQHIKFWVVIACPILLYITLFMRVE